MLLARLVAGRYSLPEQPNHAEIGQTPRNSWLKRVLAAVFGRKA